MSHQFAAVWLLWDMVGNWKWGADGVLSVILKYALSSKEVIQEKVLKFIFSFVYLSIILFLSGE